MALVFLSKGYVAEVDDADAARVNRVKWCAITSKKHDTVYAIGYLGNYRKELLHRFILRVSVEQQVDHCDGNGLNCKRDNLRLSTQQENTFNQSIRRLPNKSSQYKGVYHYAGPGRQKRWWAHITLDGRTRSLGYHATEEAAARAYNSAAVALFGRFAKPNQLAA